MSTAFRLPMVLATVLLLGACSQSSSPASSSRGSAQQQDPRSQEDLKLYQDLRAKGSYELAAPIGEGVIARAPDSPAAAEIRKTLADSQAKAKHINNTRRVQNLWLYQSGEESGGRQNTATLYPSRPADAHQRIKLILRRHSNWGQSAYLYDGDNQGFVCKGTCRLPLKVDGKDAKPLKASLPDTKDPAMFIDNDKRLLKLLESARTLDITVDVKGTGKRSLYFEVSGFDPERWPEPEKAR